MIRKLTLAVVAVTWLAPAGADDKTKTPPASAPDGASKTCSCQSCCGGGGQSTDRVFELRTYYLNEGKLGDLHKRFRDHTCSLLKKHGAELIGFWTPLDEKDGKGDKLIYLVAFPNRDAARKTWEAFGTDPEWKKVREASHQNGVLVKKFESVFMEPTDYSAMK
jgi:hypothetical protein